MTWLVGGGAQRQEGYEAFGQIFQDEPASGRRWSQCSEGGRARDLRHDMAALARPLGLREAQRSGDTTPWVNSLWSSYTGLHPQNRLEGGEARNLRHDVAALPRRVRLQRAFMVKHGIRQR